MRPKPGQQGLVAQKVAVVSSGGREMEEAKEFCPPTSSRSVLIIPESPRLPQGLPNPVH